MGISKIGRKSIVYSNAHKAIFCWAMLVKNDKESNHHFGPQHCWGVPITKDMISIWFNHVDLVEPEQQLQKIDTQGRLMQMDGVMEGRWNWSCNAKVQLPDHVVPRAGHRQRRRRVIAQLGHPFDYYSMVQHVGGAVWIPGYFRTDFMDIILYHILYILQY